MTTLPANSPVAAAAGPVAIPARLETVVTHGLVVLQLVLVLAIFHAFELEKSSGFLGITTLVAAGFAVHAALPLTFRGPFFLALGFAALGLALGAGSFGVISVGLLLIGICHLPIAFGLRVGLLVLAGAALAAFIAAGTPVIGLAPPRRLVAVLASMFMFRLIIYMYDLRHERVPAQAWMRLSYFFLLPNAVFPFFPVVDYGAFRRTYYDRPAVEIYQRGVRLIFRGATHLLLYRYIYYHYSPAADAVYGIRSVAIYFASSWLVYLHVSGLFHLIVGVLCLFGFNLPETNRLYFLASSPSDLWRRVNVYWKDFMLKIFYMPAYKALQKRKVDMKKSMIVATIVVFTATWLLHSYQWFWLVRKFPLTWVDASFWGVFGALVIANTLLQLRPRAKTRPDPRWSLRKAVIHVLKVMSMFALMSAMFAWWSTRDPATWVYMLGSVRDSGIRAWSLFAAGVAILFVVGVALHYVDHRGWTFGFGESVLPFRSSVLLTLGGAVLVLSLSRPAVQQALGKRTGYVFLSLQRERLNARDAAVEDRAYYEAMITTDQPVNPVFNARNDEEANLVPIRNSTAVRFTGDVINYELIPSRQTPNRGSMLVVNSFGLRDDEYTREKPSGTFRMALLGASVIMASGTDQPASFEALTEERLNREPISSAYSKYEILNFAVAGYGFLQFAAVAEQKVFQFQPDIVIMGALAGDHAVSRSAFAEMLAKNVQLHPEVIAIARRAGITPSSGAVEIKRKLRTSRALDELRAWSYRRIAELARRNGAIPVFMFIPRLESDEYEPGFMAMSNDARAAGMVVLDLRGVYDGFARDQLMFHRRDVHPNPLGHKLIAERLYKEIAAHAGELGITPARTP